MFFKQQIDGFEKYWRRRKPDPSTALHYASDVRIFFKWAQGMSLDAITVHIVDEFIASSSLWPFKAALRLPSSIALSSARVWHFYHVLLT